MSRRRLTFAAALILAIAAVLVWRYRGRERPATERSHEKEVARKLRDSRAKRVAPLPRAAQPTPGPVRLVPAEVSEDDAAKHGSFAGQVINWGSGKGVPGAEVVFAGSMGAATVRTDDAGKFLFEAPASGRYRVAVVSAKGYLPFAPEWGRSPIVLDARAGRRVSNVFLYLSPALSYRGRVVNAAGQPVEGATIRLLDGDVGSLALAPIDATFTSDKDGEFVFHAPDFVTLEARHPTHGMGRARVDGSVQISHRLTIKLDDKLVSYVADGVIEGKVVDEDGQPIAEVTVSAWPGGGQAVALGTARQTRSTGDGSFRLDKLDAGSYVLVARHPDYSDSSISAATGSQTTLVMKRGGTIRGRVVRAGDGEPVASFAVVVLKRQGLTSATIQQTMFVSSRGEFAVTGLAPGEYWVRAIAHGFAPSSEVKAEVAAGNAASGATITLRLPQGGQLTGKVIDAATKAPLANAKVSVENSFGAGPSSAAATATVVTDDQGEFSLRGLPIGRSSVTVAAFEHHRKILGGLVVTEGAKLGPVVIELTPTKPGEKPQLELAGLGIVLAAQGDGLVVQRLFEGGGGQEAGLVVGDVIIKVEGELVADAGMSRAIQRIRGPVNTQVAITIRRADGSVLDLMPYRRKIRV